MLGYYIIILYYSIIILLLLLYYVIIYCTILFSSSILPLFPSSSSPSFPNILNHPFLLFLYTHLFFFLYNPDTSFPSSFILYLSGVTYAYLCSFLIHLLQISPRMFYRMGCWCYCVGVYFERLRLCGCGGVLLLYYYIIIYYYIIYYTLLFFRSTFHSVLPHPSPHSFYTCRYLYTFTYTLFFCPIFHSHLRLVRNTHLSKV